MRQRWNGGIQSGNTPTYDKSRVGEEPLMYRCMVIRVVYVDDKDNFTKNSQNPEVLYDCIIIGGFRSGSILSGCRLSNRLGGSNYSSRTLKACTKDYSKTKLSENDGDIVYVHFVQGHSGYPVIVGLGTGISDKKSGATRAQGPRDIDEFNGWLREINNKGEFSITQYTGTTTNGIFQALDSINYKFEALQNEIVRETMKSGMVVEKDGKNDKFTVTTSGGVTLTVDGKNNKTTLKAGSTEVIIDGASGKVSLKAEMIDLGASVSDMVTQFTQLATAFAMHVHPYTDDGSPSMTAPPMAPLMTDVGSQTVKVQP